MDDLKMLLEGRRSIRKFLPDAVLECDIRDIIEAAVHAPSGCNSQCWHFIAVTDPDGIQKLAESVEKGVRRFYEGEDCSPAFLTGRIKQATFFRNAPCVIFVFLTDMPYHDPKVVEYYKRKGYTYREMRDELGYADILSVGAAIQNMLLMIHQKGLGACWMNDPNIAREEIQETLHVPKDSYLLSTIPLGKPAYTPRTKEMKPMDAILEIR